MRNSKVKQWYHLLGTDKESRSHRTVMTYGLVEQVRVKILENQQLTGLNLSIFLTIKSLCPNLAAFSPKTKQCINYGEDQILWETNIPMQHYHNLVSAVR